jgi:hypothetical protein
MSAGRLVGILIVAGVLVWLIKSYNVFSPASAGPSNAPLQKAKDLEKKNQERNMSLSEAAQEANQAGRTGGQVTDSMTPEQVRSLLGPPDDTESFTTDTGKSGEKWVYRAAGKTVVFEDGIVVRVE